jgi:CRP-like cAMP-binding protein
MSFATQTSSAEIRTSRAPRRDVVDRSLPETAVPDDGLSALRAIGTVVHFTRNATIFGEGEKAGYSYKVVSGAVRLCKQMSDGRRQIAEFLLPGDFFGFEWRADYSLTAEALSDVVLVRYARSRLDRLGEERCDVQRRLLTILSRDLWAAQNHVVMLGRQTAKERVVAFLLVLAERAHARSGDALDVPMCRQDIADYLGLTIETVCRAISDLKRARLIAVPGRAQIVVRNLAALRDIVEGGE